MKLVDGTGEWAYSSTTVRGSKGGSIRYTGPVLQEFQ